MAHVSGPTASMPGSAHDLPVGSMCDTHPEQLARSRIQGETDSFGAEYNDMCQTCLDEHSTSAIKARNRTGTCEWCRTPDVRVRLRRDFEEGLAGRIYDVCDECIRKENERLQTELDEISQI